MRVVLDTNVLVSALLKRRSVPARVVALIVKGCFSLLYEERLLAEYREVLGRPEFGFDPVEAAERLREIETFGERIFAPPLDLELPDPDDAAFVEVAVAGGADAIITGNKRHFPPSCGVAALTPREFLDRIDREKAG